MAKTDRSGFLFTLFTREPVILTAIVLNSLMIFLLSFDHLANSGLLQGIDYGFTLFFVAEIVVKMRVYGKKGYFEQGWNRFDFVIILLSAGSVLEAFVDSGPSLSFILIFRLFRVMKLFRFLKFIPNISHLISGIKRAAKASVFVFLAMAVYLIVIAIISTNLFAEQYPEAFGDPILSCYSVFKIFTVEGWHDIPDTISMHGGWSGTFIRFYFVFIVLTGGIFGFSMMNAIFVDEMVLDNTDDIAAKLDEMEKKIDRLLAEKEGRSD